MLRAFLDANTRMAMRMGKSLESAEEFFSAFNADVARVTGALPPGSLVVDLGGGRNSLLGRRPGIRVISVDISAVELAANRAVDETIVADVGRGLPLEDRGVDVLVSRTLLEHVEDVPGAIGEIGRVLKPGGQTLHLFPCRYSLFATVARLLPFDSALRITHFLLPSTRGVVEFQTHYDHCHPRAIERLFRQAGFRTVRVACCWSQTDYFVFFLPAFLLVAAYQTLTRLLRLRTLAAYAVVTAER